MKNYKYLTLAIILGLSISLAPACSRKSGCPANEALQMPVDKNGNIKTKKTGRSDLFGKKMKKRMKGK